MVARDGETKCMNRGRGWQPVGLLGHDGKPS